MCGKKNHEEISKFSAKDADNYVKYEHELEKFVEAVDPLLGRSIHLSVCPSIYPYVCLFDCPYNGSTKDAINNIKYEH